MSIQVVNARQQDSRIELRKYVRILAEGWVIVVSSALVGLVLAAIVSSQKPPKYEATTTLYVSVRAGDTGASGDLLQGSNFAQASMASYVNVASTAIVLDRVVDELDLGVRSDELNALLSIDSPAESVLLKITAAHSDPEVAAHIANTTGDVFMDVVENEIEVSVDGRTSPVQVRTVDSATLPEYNSRLSPVVSSVLGLLAGLSVGVGFVVLRDVLDTRVHSAKELELTTGLPVLGRIPNDDQIAQRPLIVHDNARSQRAEAFRALRTNLQFLGVKESSESGTFMVSSAMPGEGKTHVVANLAIALAESGARVTLIDADLRNPRLAQVMGIEGAAGLSDVLIDRVRLSDVLQLWGLHNLTVLPAGQIPPNPSELLGSQVMRNVLEELQEVADYVLIDAPPVLPVTDAAVISTLTSGTLLVASMGQTKRHQLDQAIESLKAVESRPLGIIANREPFKATAQEGFYSSAADGTGTEQTTPSRRMLRSRQ